MNQDVKVGQVYEDLDARRGSRTFVIEAVLNDGRALIKPTFFGTKMTKIRLERFKPWKFKLCQNPEQVTDAFMAELDSNLNELCGGIVYDVPTPKYFSSSSVSTVSVVDSLTTDTAVVVSKTLAEKCAEKISGDWKDVSPNVAALSSGCLGLVVRNFDDTSYDVKIKLDGLIVDTWAAKHFDIEAVLSYLREKLEAMQEDFVSVLKAKS